MKTAIGTVATSVSKVRRPIALSRYRLRMHVLRIVIVAALWVAAGCTASSGNGASFGTASAQPSQVPGPTPSGNPGAISLPASVVDPVVAEIARLASVPTTAVVVQTAEAVTYPDGGLGCPLPGVTYTQVQVDGYRIVATAAGSTYDYRGSVPGVFRLCKTPSG